MVDKTDAINKTDTIAQIRLLSDILSRSRLASLAGKSFEGERDLYAAFGYDRNLTTEKYWQRYKRNGIAAKVVSALPKATWHGEMELIEDDNPDNVTEFEKAWNELNNRLNIWSIFERADILAGLGEFSVILIGAPGELSEELQSTLNADNIVYLTPFSQRNVSIKQYEKNIEDARYGKPTVYELQQLKPSTVNSTITKQVHWTRIIHIADGILDNDIQGIPRLEPVWNYLDDLEKVSGAGAEAFFLRSHPGFHLDIDPEHLATLSSSELTDIRTKIEEYVHGFTRILATRGSELKMLGSDVADFNNPIDAIITLIAGSTGIPKRILVGSERGELASSQDQNNWDSRVAERRQSFAEPQIIRPFVQLLIDHKVLPEPKEYSVKWPEIIQLDEMSKAKLATQYANLNRLSGEVVITGAEIRDKVLGLDPLEEDIELEPKVETIAASSGKDNPW